MRKRRRRGGRLKPSSRHRHGRDRTLEFRELYELGITAGSSDHCWRCGQHGPQLLTRDNNVLHGRSTTSPIIVVCVPTSTNCRPSTSTACRPIRARRAGLARRARRRSTVGRRRNANNNYGRRRRPAVQDIIVSCQQLWSMLTATPAVIAAAGRYATVVMPSS